MQYLYLLRATKLLVLPPTSSNSSLLLLPTSYCLELAWSSTTSSSHYHLRLANPPCYCYVLATASNLNGPLQPDINCLCTLPLQLARTCDFSSQYYWILRPTSISPQHYLTTACSVQLFYPVDSRRMEPLCASNTCTNALHTSACIIYASTTHT